MARSPNKHGRDQAQDFQGFLNDLQDWELSLKDKDKKMKQQPSTSSNLSSEKFRPSGSGKYDVVKKYASSDDDSQFDANSEKEQGNEYFKQKKFNEAIDCYSRSIALSPNSVAFSNRAMAYLKIKRLAEVDCTEALNLDDRYIKAYSRRATARKQLGMIKEAKEDAEFALRLEPESQELKKQYSDIKSLLEKEIIERATGAMQRTAQDMLKTAGLEKKTELTDTEMKLKPVTIGEDMVRPSKESSGKKLIGSVQSEEKNEKGSKKVPAITETEDSKKVTSRIQSYEMAAKSSNVNGTQPSGPGNRVTSRKLELKPSVQELAAHAASLAMAEVSKNIQAPKSAYEFENSWRNFSGDPALQNQLLKVTKPSSLPQIFKNALTSPVLFDIIKCVASFFNEDMDLAVKYIYNLTKVPRFDMIVMCLASTEKNELRKIWEDVFCNKATPVEYAEVLDKLRSRYCLKQWKVATLEMQMNVNQGKLKSENRDMILQSLLLEIDLLLKPDMCGMNSNASKAEWIEIHKCIIGEHHEEIQSTKLQKFELMFLYLCGETHLRYSQISPYYLDSVRSWEFETKVTSYLEPGRR
ncbi:BnaA03g60750D [Brassica napus]|uniref:BnaA03g60750D protein n=1 Tax=Brassica napus TaxID=3708 RepID=A0A078J033_BRANA|nr:BnaA03g60750D [Brassica napus]